MDGGGWVPITLCAWIKKIIHFIYFFTVALNLQKNWTERIAFPYTPFPPALRFLLLTSCTSVMIDEPTLIHYD